jgi:hypothetical protein
LTELGIDSVKKIIPMMDIAKNCGWFIPCTNLCILQHRHSELHRDSSGRLHNPTGMAVKYRDGWGVYAWHGLRIPYEKSFVIESPDKIAARIVDEERNAELRRVMLERMTLPKYLFESQLTPIAVDECGELYRKELPGDEPLTMVLVKNSTPEPDGSRRQFLLRVHPELRPMLNGKIVGERQEFTARNAVASTFGLYGSQYYPSIES